MKIIRKLISILAFVTTVIIALQYNYQLSLWYALLITVLGVLWYRLGSVRLAAPHIGFLCFSLLIALDVNRHGISIWSIITIHSALALWDLLAFHNRLAYQGGAQDDGVVAQHHISRLGYIIAAGLILSFTTLYLQSKMTILGIIVSGLVVMMALSNAIKLLRRDTA